MPSGKHKKHHHPAPPRHAEVSKEKKDKAKDKDKDKTKDEEDEEELVELPFVDLDDQALIRRILEDELADVLEEKVKFLPNFTFSNIKLALMTSALFVGVIAHFVPNPYVESAVSNPVFSVQERLGRISSAPLLDNNQLLGACIVLFFSLQGALQVMQWTLEANYVYLSNPSNTKFGFFPTLYFRTHMPRYNYEFTVDVINRRGEKLTSWTTEAYKYFTESGFFLEEKYREDVYDWAKKEFPKKAKQGKVS